MHPTEAARPPLDKDRLLTLRPTWAQVEVLDSTPSTNRVATSLAREGAAHGLVVVAEAQTQGRGRLDRSWVSPPSAGLTFSVVLRPPAQAPEAIWGWYPLAAGVAVVEGVIAAGGPRCVLKWPNDVMYDGLKLGGLLAERVNSPLGSAVVVGVGLNVSTTRGELPVPTASSLRLAGWTGVDRTALFAHVLTALGRRLGAEGTAMDLREVAEAYTARCETLASHVRVELPGGPGVTGRAEAISEDGSLQVRDEAGELHSVSAGDVVHLKTAEQPPKS